MKGIYKITQKSTQKVYIGQSKNIFARWNQHIQSIDNLSFHKAYRAAPTDFTFDIVEQNDNYTKEDLDKAEKRWIINTHADDPKYGFNGTAGNGDYKPFKPIQMKMVCGSINKYIHSEYLKTIENKKILVIGNFRFCDTLSLYNNVTIITDDCDFTCEDAKVIKVSTGEELMGEINKIEKDQFDLIIANPPYNLGNKIVSQFVDLAKESVVLMPFSYYKNKELYKHIRDLQLVDPKTFKDAQITNNLCVCKLIDKKIDQTYEEIELQTYNPKYKLFYELNKKLSAYYIIMPNMPDKYDINENKLNFNTSVDFLITTRTSENGVHKLSTAHDFIFNIDKNFVSCLSYIIRLSSEKAKDNLCRFWYKNPLMNDLIKGLNKKGGHIYDAIPHIDWSIDRDYEHCTLDDIMRWLEEDNQ